MPERTRCDACRKRRNVTADPSGMDLCSSCVEWLDAMRAVDEQLTADVGGSGTCDEPCPTDATAGGCWLSPGHDGEHLIDGGAYRWPKSGGMQEGSR